MSVDNAVKSLAILTAIPVVLLAIWTDYFGRVLERVAKDNLHYDRTPELNKIRLAGVCAIFFQLGIYMGTTDVRQAAPIISNLIFVAAVLVQSWIQGSIERKVRKPSPKLMAVVDADGHNNATSSLSNDPNEREPIGEMDMALRAFFWATLGGALYLAGFALPVFAVGFFSRFLGFSEPMTAAVVVVSAILGMLAGVALNFALGAFYLRRMLPTRELAASELRTHIESCFSRAQIPLPSLWVIQTGRAREAMAMMAGFSRGRGLFRPGMFLSQALIDNLTQAEVNAVVMHEVAHLRLHHLRKRMLYSVGLVAAVTTAATFCVYLAAALMPAESQARGFVGLAAAAGAFVTTFKLLSAQSRLHELQSDAFAVAQLGASSEVLISALRKLDQVNGRSARTMPFATGGLGGHPSTEARVEALRARFGNSERAEPDQKRAA